MSKQPQEILTKPGTRLLVAVVGPTASGKSALALRAAEILGGEIVNCDAMQVYCGLDIGTAKPSEQERKRIPHHLYDLIGPAALYSAGRYVVDARRVCSEIADRGGIPFVVGGTGLYLRVLLEGIFHGPGRSDAMRERLGRIAKKKGVAYLHALLCRKDPAAGGRIQARDQRRIMRALEIYFSTGSPISQLQDQRKPLEGFSVLKLGLNLPRDVLYGRINGRVARMFDEGLTEEVKRLLDEGYRDDCKAFEALGYRHVLSALRGGLSQPEAIELTCRDTRRYAKRQMTWFRKEPQIRWIDSPGESRQALDQLLTLAACRTFEVTPNGHH